jgi:hypothetical protein
MKKLLSNIQNQKFHLLVDGEDVEIKFVKGQAEVDDKVAEVFLKVAPAGITETIENEPKTSKGKK